MATDEEISQALLSLFCNSSSSSSSPNPNKTITTSSSLSSLNDVVQQLQSKLGHDLSHKVDFIRSQIRQLFQPPPTHKDHFALHQPHNFQPTQSSPAPASSATATAIAAGAPEPPKQSAQPKAKRRGGPGGLNKLCGVSPELQAIVGQPELPRTEIVKQLWAYIRKNNLQDPNNKRKIICNDELRILFETDCTDMFKMNKLLAKHIIPLEPTKESSSKKLKVDAESGMRSIESGPYVMISEALANFFGVGEREMLQAEVLRRLWEYIKANHLEDPLNSMVILCDAKLQGLFGCESVPALGIPEILGRHHIRRR